MENQSKSLIRVKNCLASIPWIFHPRLPRIPWSKVILLTVIWVKIDKQSKILPKILIKTCGLIQLMSLNSFLPSGCGLRSTKPHTKKIFSGCTLESWVCGMCNRVFLFFFSFLLLSSFKCMYSGYSIIKVGLPVVFIKFWKLFLQRHAT